MLWFTREDLAQCDGREGWPILIAYEGRVYDVTGSFPWRNGFHWGCAHAGRDVTDRIGVAPHGPDLLLRVPCIGWLVD